MADQDTDPTGHEALLAELRAEILARTHGEKQSRLLARVRELETSPTSPSFGDHIKALTEEAEEDAALIAPFLSRLSSLLP